jgi:hypothetical protein
MLNRIKRLGWVTVESGLVLIALCMIFNIILGQESGSFISAVAENATKFIQSLPPGVTIGIAMIALVYWLAENRAR